MPGTLTPEEAQVPAQALGGRPWHYRVVDVKIDFYDGKMHPVDSKDIAFQIAGYFAFKEAFMNARPCLLEPIHEVDVLVPEEQMGDVLADLNGRRGRVSGMDTRGATTVEISATVQQPRLWWTWDRGQPNLYTARVAAVAGGCGKAIVYFAVPENSFTPEAGKRVQDSRWEVVKDSGKDGPPRTKRTVHDPSIACGGPAGSRYG